MLSAEKSSVTWSRILRMPGVEDKTGLKKSKIYEMMATGEFPRSIPLVGTRARGWVEAEIDDWIAARVALREVAA